MKKIDWYHETVVEDISFKKYLSIFLVLCFLLLSILTIRVDNNLPVRLIKKEDGYEIYLLEEQLNRIESNGVLFTRKNQYHYTLNPIVDHQMTFGESSYYLVRFQFQEGCKESILSGRIQISRNTILERMISLWKEEAK